MIALDNGKLGKGEGEAVPGTAALRLLLDQTNRLGWRYWAFAVATAGVGLSALLPAQFLRAFTEGAALAGGAGQVGALLAFGLTAAAIIAFTGYFGRSFQETFRFRIEGDLRRSVVRRLHEIPLTALDGSARGEWVQRVTEDLASVERFVAEAVPRQIRYTALFLGVAVLLSWRGGPSAVVALVGAVALAVLQGNLERRAQPLRAQSEAVHDGALSMLRETLEGMRTIRSHGAEPFLERRFDAKLSSLQPHPIGSALPTGFTLQVLFTVTLTVVAFAVQSGQIPVRDALVFPFFLALLYKAALCLVEAASDWRKFLVEGARLGSVIYGTDRFASSPDLEKASVSFKHADQLQVRDLVLGNSAGPLAGPFEFTLGRGELWAILGPTACGKSTLLEVLAGLRPGLSGAARIVHKEGATLWESTGRGGLWLPVGACAYVEPRPFLFEGTLRENLTFGNADRLSDAVLWDFLERSGLFEFARDRGGLDAPMLHRHLPLGEPERRQIALCRGLLLKRPFLLLDEPFRGLDDKTIATLSATLEYQKRYSGLVVVTQSVPLALSVDGVFSFERAVDGWRGQIEGPETEADSGATGDLPLFQSNATSAQPAIPAS